MKYLSLVLALLASEAVSAQDWAQAALQKSPRHQEWTTVKHDGRSVETYVVYPESKDKRPVVVVIHEIFGMTDWVEDLSDQLTAAGYIAVAPDLLLGWDRMAVAVPLSIRQKPWRPSAISIRNR